MGTSHSWGELEHKLNRLADDLSGGLPKLVVSDAALEVKKSVLHFAPARLSGVGKRGAKLSARYNLSTTGSEVKALVYANGPWQLIEGDTKAHTIPRKRKVGKVALKGQPTSTGFAAVAHHRGTHGKHPWRKGVEAARPAVARMFAAKGAHALAKIF